MVEKLIKDGKVAILISPGLGAGWSTWNWENAEELLFDKELIEKFINDRPNFEKFAEEKYPDCYLSTRDLCVEWIDQGTQFEINEYDGNESLHIIGPRTGFIA